ncbi:sialidase family protein [Butyricimonas paravirosa]|uniref:sialidase family protein n=1 Tax=Butyricimonas paravirosa TaxID=1472417 RepID=UPI00210C1378|nr:sialidase family protein [Butyricimonas paravirosa]MCQ4875223.1 exo-alpha-sialidase [Butyricimonas paravirosa]
MSRFLFLVTLVLSLFSAKGQEDILSVYQPTLPIVINRENNMVAELCLQTRAGDQALESITLKFTPETPLEYVENVSLYYAGTAKPLNSVKNDNSSYSIFVAREDKVERELTLNFKQTLFPHFVNYFWISLKLARNTPLTEKFVMTVTAAVSSNGSIKVNEHNQAIHRPAVIVRDAGDDGVRAYRIPGLVTAPDGTLVAVYDIRRNNSADLQEDIQIGVSRSRDGGKTWLPMQVAMDMRGYGGLPDAQNGVGDPAILSTGEDLWIMALWTHGMGGQRAWTGCRKNAMMPGEQAAQVLVARSRDNGQTWEKPINITSQIKDPSWGILLQGPGRGITMKSGMMVFPFQFVDKNDMPHATIVYSGDRGKTWKIGTPARDNTTEAQVVELKNGDLMLNMRDNRGGTRAVMTTSDMGKTWQDHPSSRKALVEPVCMASLIVYRDLLFFSNPANSRARTDISVKWSGDQGLTWSDGLLLDSGGSWGYSCLTVIDEETVGILYESSQAHLIFQAIKLEDLLKK